MPSFLFNTDAKSTPSVENATLSIGQELLADIRAHRGKLSSLRKNFSDKLMDWAMSDPGFKVQLFRFVDVFPTLRGPVQIHDLLLDYLQQPGVNMPSGLDWGLRAGSIIKGTFAKTIASNIARMAETFIAGASANDAIPKLRADWKRGIAFSADLLGEACLSDEEANRYRERYVELIRSLANEVTGWPNQPILDSDHLGSIPRANVSIKISSLAAQLKPRSFDGTVDLLYESLQPLLNEASKRNVHINFDMEQYELKDVTLALFQRCCEQIDFHAGIALQAYLRSGPEDAKHLIDWSKRTGRQVTVRLIKGAYWDYEVINAQQLGWPVPVWAQKWETDACFEAMTRQFVADLPTSANEGGVKLALGSHNARSIAHALAAVRATDLPPSALEFQLLEGMADALRQTLINRKLRVRTYVPLGEMIPGMAYLVRRLLENTSNESWLRDSTSHETDDQLLADPAASYAGRSSRPSSDSSVSDDRCQLEGFENEPTRNFADRDQRRRFSEAVSNATVPAKHPEATVADAVAAVGRAQDAFESWNRVSASDRCSIIRKAAAAMRNQRDALAAQIVVEAGKPWKEADADVCEAIDFCDYYAQQASDLFAGQSLGCLIGESNHLQYRGIGVAAIISPWNFPLAICTGMTAAALVSGNPALVKPAEQTTDIAARMCQILWDAGIPDDVLQFIPGKGETVGASLVRDPRVHLIAFTGSREVGFQILEAAGKVSEAQAAIKRVVCEMGGKNAIIVDSTADLDEAVAGVCHSAFDYAGQKCSACSRVIVVGEHHDLFLKRLVAMTRSLTVGDPRAPGTDIGPVIDESAAKKIRHYIDIGRQQNQLELAMQVDVQLAQRVGRPFVPPHIFSHVGPDDALATDEVFGPVLAVMTCSTFDEALDLANRGVYKLTGAVYSRTPAHLQRARSEFHVGNLYLNRGSTGAIVGRQAFGGFGHSGTGTKAGGPDYLRHFVHPVLVCENTMRRGFAPGLD